MQKLLLVLGSSQQVAVNVVNALMELHKRYFAVVALILTTFATMALADDFADARTKIDQAKPNIHYNTFCAEMNSGEDKIACRIKDVPTVGFLVCKEPNLGEKNCSTVINEEVTNIEKVQREGAIKTVMISPPPIDGVKCGNDSSIQCSGFLEKWLAKDKAKFEQVRDHISDNTTEKLITDVKNFTSQAGLSSTATDLSKIKTYMTVDKTRNKYRQICDLQGFFLATGGFLVADVPDVLEDTTIDGKCYDGEPTTEDVLDALDRMISAFNPENGNGDHHGVSRSSGPDFNINTLTGLQTFLIILFGRNSFVY
ncbi:uncharacterized protein [Acropora muricata]|uniref:uncharacterized protein n=1 Tax=Acropora muricata TaxID=159855 RepID=UPI0010FC81DC